MSQKEITVNFIDWQYRKYLQDIKNILGDDLFNQWVQTIAKKLSDAVSKIPDEHHGFLFGIPINGKTDVTVVYSDKIPGEAYAIFETGIPVKYYKYSNLLGLDNQQPSHNNMEGSTTIS